MLDFENAELMAKCYEQFRAEGGVGITRKWLNGNDVVEFLLDTKIFFEMFPAYYEIEPFPSDKWPYQASAMRNGRDYIAIFSDAEAEKYGVVLPEQY